ncbi:MAG: hypothetical protein M3Y65_21985 [Pseudomonadota bacterium]|nr:hypothetical protein [Pseudomonadota bacterium]
MKLLTLLIVASAVVCGGCASAPEGEKVAGAPVESTYTPLGSLIAKKSSTRSDKENIDMQSFDNQRTMESGVNNGGR